MAANVPPLGLSNRAIACELPYPFVRPHRRLILTSLVFALAQAEADQLPPASNDPFEAVAAIDFRVNEEHPPLEEQLLGSTLWPEVSGYRQPYRRRRELIEIVFFLAPLDRKALRSFVRACRSLFRSQLTTHRFSMQSYSTLSRFNSTIRYENLVTGSN